jgi:hypothetical protein
MSRLTLSDCSLWLCSLRFGDGRHQVTFTVQKVAHCSSLSSQFSHLSTTAAHHLSRCSIVMWHSPCTQWLTAAGSSLSFLTFPPPLHTTYHSAVSSCDIHRAHSSSLQQAHLSIFSPFHHRSTPPITVQYPWTATTLSHPQLWPAIRWHYMQHDVTTLLRV